MTLTDVRSGASGTHADVERATRMLLSRDIGVMAVAVRNPAYSPSEYSVAACGIRSYDIMIPGATVDEKPPRIAAFYNSVFDLWLEANPISRYLSPTWLLRGDAPSVVHRPVELCTVMTDGSVESHDVLRIAGNGVTQTSFNIFDHTIDDVRNEPRWKAAREASVNLCEKCRQCNFSNACGGGYLPHRFSTTNGYDNPSVYCDDLYAMFEHIQAALGSHIYVRTLGGQRLNVRDELARRAV